MDVSERLYNTNAKNVCSYTTPQVLCLTVIDTKIGSSDIFRCLLLFPCVIKKEKNEFSCLLLKGKQRYFYRFGLFQFAIKKQCLN